MSTAAGPSVDDGPVAPGPDAAGADGPPPALDLAEALREAGLPDAAWEDVRLAAGEVLFEAGAPSDAFYVVRDGQLEAYLSDAKGRRVVLERLGPGASFGEIGLLDGGQRTAGVAALSEDGARAAGGACVRMLRRAVFHEALLASPALGSSLLALVGGRLRRNLRHIDYLIDWAGLVAEGRYDDAQKAIARAAESAGADSVRFVTTFTSMVALVKAREGALERELAALRVEIDQSRRAAAVTEITETDFFRELQQEARRLRGRAAGEGV